MEKKSKKRSLLKWACALGLVFAAPAAAEIKDACLTDSGAVVKMGDKSFLRLNYQFQLYGAWRDTGPDDTDPSNEFYFRRNRLTFSGQASELVSFNIKLEASGDRTIGPVEVVDEPVGEFDVIEAYATIDISRAFRITAGKMKIPFVREILEGCFSSLTLDRSLFVYTPFQRSRDTGVTVWGNLKQSRFQYMLAAMNGQQSGAAPEKSPRYSGRVHISLLDAEDSFGYSGTYLGSRMVFTIGAGAQYEPRAAYSDAVAQTGEKDYTAWTADIFIEYPIGTSGMITLSGAYLRTDFEKAYQGSNPNAGVMGIDGEKQGWYVKTGYLFIDKFGPGQLQPFARYEEWEFAYLNDQYAQRVKWTGVGLNYLIDGQSLRLTAEYSKTDFEDETSPSSKDFNTVIAMFQFGF